VQSKYEISKNFELFENYRISMPAKLSPKTVDFRTWTHFHSCFANHHLYLSFKSNQKCQIGPSKSYNAFEAI